MRERERERDVWVRSGVRVCCGLWVGQTCSDHFLPLHHVDKIMWGWVSSQGPLYMGMWSLSEEWKMKYHSGFMYWKACSV